MTDGSYSEDNIEIDGLTRGESRYDGVFITHYHADHCGLIERINDDIPIYTSGDTLKMLNIISDFIDAPPPRIDHIIDAGDRITVGDITLTALWAMHSAWGSLAYLIEADGKKLFYTGDFYEFDDGYFSLIGHIDAMLCEGTNIGASNEMTESQLSDKLGKIMLSTTKPIFVLSSTTNLPRFRSVFNACCDTGRVMATDPFMRAININESFEFQSLKAVGFMPYYMSEEKTPRAYKYTYSFENYSNAQNLSKMTFLTYFVRESMGKFLKRLDRYKSLKGSILVYSMWKGYTETQRMKAFLDTVRSLGIEIVYLHTSGHAYRDTLQKAILRFSPDTLIPIHTDNPQAFSELFENVKLLDDGEEFTV
jgi:ribonuclease J